MEIYQLIAFGVVGVAITVAGLVLRVAQLTEHVHLLLHAVKYLQQDALQNLSFQLTAVKALRNGQCLQDSGLEAMELEIAKSEVMEYVTQNLWDE